MKRYLGFFLAPLFALALAMPVHAYEWLQETKVVSAEVSDVPLWRAYRLTEDGEASAWPVCREFLNENDLLERYSVRMCAEQVAELSALNYDEDMSRVTKEMVLWGPAPENTRADVLARYEGRDAESGAALILDPEKLREVLGLAEDVAVQRAAIAGHDDRIAANRGAIDMLEERADGHEAALADLRNTLSGTEAGLAELAGLPEETDRLAGRLDAVEGRVEDRFGEFDRRLSVLENAPAAAASEAEPAPEPEATAPETADEGLLEGLGQSLVGWVLFGIFALLVLLLLCFILGQRQKRRRNAEADERRPNDEEQRPRASQADHDALAGRVGEVAEGLGDLTTRVGELEGGHEKLGRRITAAQGMTTKAGNRLGGRIDALEGRVASVEGMVKLIITVITDGASIVGGLPTDEQLRSLDEGESIELALAHEGSPNRRTLLVRRDQDGYKLLGLADREEVAFNGTFKGLQRILGRALRRDAQDPGTIIIGVEKESAAA